MTGPADGPLLTPATFTGAVAAKRAHKQALAVALTAGPEPDDTDGLLDQIAHKVADRLLTDLNPAPDVEQPRDAAGRWASGFDGGARPLPPPRPESHEQTLTRLLRSAVARQHNIDF